jgi:transketolase
MGDGEQSEGSIWEAAANAVHSKLGNLVAILDFNGLEADGTINEITSLGNIADKYRAFGWNVIEINGNNIEDIVSAFDALPDVDSEVPTCIVAHTIKGKGVDFMENQVRWHAGKISDEQLCSCVDQLRLTYERRWSA